MRLSPGCRPPIRQGLTLIEVLVVISIIALLAAMAFPALSVVRNRARLASARSTISNLTIALDTYAQEEDRHRYPLHDELFVAPAPAPYEISRSPLAAYGEGLIGLLLDRNLLPLGAVTISADGKLLDPWQNPFRYQLKRPVPAANATRLADWNWDAALARESRWDAARNQASPYPYVYTLGPEAKTDDAAGWIYHAR